MRKTRSVQTCLSIALQLYKVLGTQNDRKTDKKASETKKRRRSSLDSGDSDLESSAYVAKEHHCPSPQIFFFLPQLTSVVMGMALQALAESGICFSSLFVRLKLCCSNAPLLLAKKREKLGRTKKIPVSGRQGGRRQSRYGSVQNFFGP